MDAVLGSLVILSCGAGMNVVDVLVLLAGDLHQAVGKGYPAGFEVIAAVVEITVLPVDGPLEDQRFAGMGCLDLLDEGEQPFADLLEGRIGE